MRHRLSLPVLSGFLLMGLVACGGSNNNEPAPVVEAKVSGLVYTDPTGTGWRLVQDATSTPTRLVLNLVGPSGFKCRGVGMNVQAGDGVAFATFPNKWHAADTGVFELKNVAPDADNPPPSPEPVLFAAGVKPGNVLTAGLFQKDRRATAKDTGKPLMQIALTLDSAKSGSLAIGDALKLAVIKARILPADIGTVSDGLGLIAKSDMQAVQVAVGKLATK